VLEALASTYPADSQTIGFVALDAEALPEISEKYDVSAVPFIVLQKAGQTVDTVSGSDAAKIRAAIEKFAPSSSSTNGLPPAQSTTKPTGAAPHVNGNGVTKDLSGYTPGPGAPQTTADQASKEVSKEELFKRLESLVKAAPVMLFMKGTPSAPQCGFSRQTVALLRDRSIRYGFFNILADDDVRQGMKEFSDWPTFPQLYVGGELIGGLDIVSQKPAISSYECTNSEQIKEQFQDDPDFLLEYSVSAPKPETAASSSAVAQTA
jgi:Grx4 family monothiol glutaredoxin